MTVANHVTRSPPSAISSRLSQTIRHHVPSQRHTPNCMISLSIMPLYPATSRHIPVYQSICPPTGSARLAHRFRVQGGIGRGQPELVGQVCAEIAEEDRLEGFRADLVVAVLAGVRLVG